MAAIKRALTNISFGKRPWTEYDEKRQVVAERVSTMVKAGTPFSVDEAAFEKLDKNAYERFVPREEPKPEPKPDEKKGEKGKGR